MKKVELENTFDSDSFLCTGSVSLKPDTPDPAIVFPVGDALSDDDLKQETKVLSQQNLLAFNNYLKQHYAEYGILEGYDLSEAGLGKQSVTIPREEKHG